MNDRRKFQIRLCPHMVIIAVAAALFTSCAPAPVVQYIGHSYQPVERVDLYLAEDSIPMGYRVMGRLQAEAAFEYRADKIQEYVIKYAAEHGASAVIIEGLDILEDEPVHETQIIEKKRDDTKSTSVSVTDSLKKAAESRQRSIDNKGTTREQSTTESARSGERGTGTNGKPAAGTKTSQVERTAGESTSSTTIREISYRPRRLLLRAVLIRYE